MKNILCIIMILILSMFLSGCDKNIEFDNASGNNENIENKAPTANAGNDRTTAVFTSIEIEGSGTDSDGEIVDYEWREEGILISGLKKFTYMPSTEGTHTLTLIVLDDDDKAGSDTMDVTVTSK